MILTLTSVVFTYVSVVLTMDSSADHHKTLSRQKRTIFQMCELISIHTNRGCFDYNNYGCFCGLGNSDSRPVDAVDNCCRVHDECYGHTGCLWLYPQFVSYTFQCSQDGCQCSDSPSTYPCAHSTCLCDLHLAQCLGRSLYNQRFSNYRRRACNQHTSQTLLRSAKSSKRKQTKRPRKLKIKTRKRKQSSVLSRLVSSLVANVL